MATERSPRISANKLGEYMVASFVRRRSIIKDQKRQPTAKGARYAAAVAPVLEFLTTRDVRPLHDAVARLGLQQGATSWKESDRLATVKALVQISSLADELLKPEWHFSAPPSHPRKLAIGGTEVSVQPHAIVHGTKAGREVFGALRFHFIQDEESSLDKRGGDFVATILHRWCVENPWRAHLAHPSFSLAVDVFSSSVSCAPARSQKRMENIEAACEEIALRWPTL